MLAELLSHENQYVRLYAVNVLDHLDEKAAPVKDALIKAKGDSNNYVKRVVSTALSEFQ